MHLFRWVLCVFILFAGVFSFNGWWNSRDVITFEPQDILAVSEVQMEWHSLYLPKTDPSGVNPRLRRSDGNQLRLSDGNTETLESDESRTIPKRISAETGLSEEWGNSSNPPTDSAIPETYTIRSGDTLSEVAERFFGAWSRGQKEIERLNPKINVNRIKVGQVLILRGSSRLSNQEENNSSNKISIDNQRLVHRVKNGESLAAIAVRYYGDENWEKIHKANLNILPNPNRLKVGMELVIP
jgi:LysM repeat protein